MDQLDRDLRRELDEHEANRRWKRASDPAPSEPPGGRSMRAIGLMFALEAGADEARAPSPASSVPSAATVSTSVLRGNDRGATPPQ